ncbi:GntR family transcriptional regulator [Hoeflea sp.]|uniref:GntR family transcriptional regulator n=1 Tax=Hoeflea sp. TaxID=1940281 RepID=UPI003B518485
MPDFADIDPFRLPQTDDGARETQATQAYHAIRAMILRCELQPGATISDKTLGNKLDFGRTPIREALLRLSSERLVLFLRNQSIIVAPIELGEINDLYTLRLHLERLAWRLWLGRASDSQVERLASIFDDIPKLVRAGDVEGLLHLDFLFHSQVYRECENPFLTQSLYNLSGTTYRIWHMTSTRDVQVQADTARSHAPIIEAVYARDAARLDSEIEAHITHAYDQIMQSFLDDTVKSVGELPIKLFNKEAKT